jgi:uncharacterized cupredoxin-like copper-binding protein
MRNLLAATGAAVAFSFTFAGASPATAPVPSSMLRPAAANVLPTPVTVTMREFVLVLSRKTVPRGKVVFHLRNRGEIAHKFRIKGVTSARVAPGANLDFTVRFTAAGQYKYICPMPGHAKAGQRGTLTVK